MSGDVKELLSEGDVKELLSEFSTEIVGRNRWAEEMVDAFKAVRPFPEMFD